MDVVQRFHRENLAFLSLASATKGRLKLDPWQPSDKYVTESRLGYDREQVEVLARSNTFPSVLNLGELMLSVEYPNPTLLCLDAAYYAGKAQGLIWAMDGTQSWNTGSNGLLIMPRIYLTLV